MSHALHGGRSRRTRTRNRANARFLYSSSAEYMCVLGRVNEKRQQSTVWYSTRDSTITRTSILERGGSIITSKALLVPSIHVIRKEKQQRRTTTWLVTLVATITRTISSNRDEQLLGYLLHLEVSLRSPLGVRNPNRRKKKVKDTFRMYNAALSCHSHACVPS